MKSKAKIAIEIFAVLFLLTAMVSVCIYAEWKENERIIETTKIYPEMDEIEFISYLRGSKVRTLVKLDGVWYWEDKTNLVVDQIEMQEKIDALLEITAIDKVKNLQNREEYGVDNPVYSIVLSDINQKTTTISLGNMTGENNYYVKIDEQEDIYIVTKEVKEIIISIDSNRNLQQHLDAISSPTR